MLISEKQEKQEQIVQECAARLNLDPWQKVIWPIFCHFTPLCPPPSSPPHLWHDDRGNGGDGGDRGDGGDGADGVTEASKIGEGGGEEGEGGGGGEDVTMAG